MEEAKKIPLWVAVVINANIVVGSAFFLGVQSVTATNGVIAPLAWLLCGLFLLPLVMVLARLSLHHHAAGGLYVYSKINLGPTWGFISGWGYFVGTIAANAAVIHAFCSEVQKLGRTGAFFERIGLKGLALDVFFILLFTLFNLMNVAFLERLQIAFAVLKCIPLLLILVSLPMLFDASNLIQTRIDWYSLLNTLPLVLFAYVGIEACCSIADKIENGKQNAAKAIMISFGLIMVVYTVLQCALLCIHGAKNVNPFLSILPMLTANQSVIMWGNYVIMFAILSSFLGGFYGMFYYNNWNLFAMGQERSIVGADQIVKLNKNQSPWVCVLVQSALTIIFLLVTSKSYYLITMSDFGTLLAYLFSTLAFLALFKSMTGIFALVSCSILGLIIVKNLLNEGFYYVAPFAILILLGLAAHWLRRKPEVNEENHQL